MLRERRLSIRVCPLHPWYRRKKETPEAGRIFVWQGQNVLVETKDCRVARSLLYYAWRRDRVVTVDSICADAKALSADAKAEVIDRLLADISAEIDSDVERAWVELAERRSEAILSGAVRPIPGPEALKRVRDSLRR